jgi:hypothetical protein
MEDCSGVDFDHKILILLAKRGGENQEIDQFITKCRNHFSEEFLFQLSQVNNKKESLEKILKRFRTDVEKKKIQEIFLTDEFKNPQKEFIGFFIQEMNEKKDNIKRNALILKTVQKQPEGLFRYLLELSVALDSDNQAWSKKIAKKIINMEPQELLFQRVIESEELKNQVREVIQVFLTKFKLKFKNEMLKKMLINQLSNLYPSESFKNHSFWSNDWTLSEMKNFLGSRNYGRPFIGFWFLELIPATHEAEVMQFLKEVLDKESVSKYGRSFPWIFTFYPFENFRSEVISIFKDLWNTGSTYQKFLVLESLENPKMKEIMSKEIPELSKPTFQIKRTLFLNMLKKGENLNFSIYQLLKLGDRSEELLWWVTFFEK